MFINFVVFEYCAICFLLLFPLSGFASEMVRRAVSCLWCLLLSSNSFTPFLIYRAFLEAYGELYFRAWRSSAGVYLEVTLGVCTFTLKNKLKKTHTCCFFMPSLLSVCQPLVLDLFLELASLLFCVC